MEFVNKEYSILQNHRAVENYNLFKEEVGRPEGEVMSERKSFIKGYSPYSVKKINLFSYLADCYIMVSDVYETPWSNQWERLSKESLMNEAAIQHLTIGTSHSIAVNNKSRLFTWGWNDSG